MDGNPGGGLREARFHVVGADQGLVTDEDTLLDLLKFLSLPTSNMVFGGPGLMSKWIRVFAAWA